jgi:hypothetical protein
MAIASGTALGQSSGPSFGCAKARNVTERVICAEPELAKADREMAATWRRAIASVRTATDRDTLDRDQAEWLKGRDQGCFLDAEQCRFFCGARGALSGHYHRTPPSRRCPRGRDERGCREAPSFVVAHRLAAG